MQPYYVEEWDCELPARRMEVARTVEAPISPAEVLPAVEAAELMHAQAR
jgi:hypothetical protein